MFAVGANGLPFKGSFAMFIGSNEPHLLGHPLHLAGAGACGVHLDGGGNEGAFDALVLAPGDFSR